MKTYTKVRFYSFGLYCEWYRFYDDGGSVRDTYIQNTFGM